MSTATNEPKTRSAGAVRTDRLRPNAWNKARPLDEAFVASVKARGILSPLLLREVEEDSEGRDIEIIAGERRWRAAVEVGLEYVPAVIHNMADEDAQTDTLIENTHRVGLSPWQEAQLVGELLEKPGMDVSAVSAATGWSEAMIRRRAKLLELSPSWMKAMEKGALPLWTIAHWETLAIYDEKQQESLWDRMEYDEGIRGASVADLRRELARDTKVLKHAPWKLDDATLCPEAGSCQACPNRTGANADLFEEVDAKVKDGDRCLNEECYDKKQAAWLKVKEVEAKEKHGADLVKLDKHYSGEKGALHEHQIERVKKSTPGAVPALVVSGKGLGGIEWVKPKKGEKPSADGRGQGPKSMEQKREELEKRRTIRALELLIAYIEDEGGDLEFTPEAFELLTQYALVRGVEVGDVTRDDERIRAYAKKPITLEELWEGVKDDLVDHIDSVIRDTVANLAGSGFDSSEVKFCAWMVEADLKALKAQADQEIPEPKSWANEAAAERMAGGKKPKVSKAAAQALVDGSAADELDGPDEDLEDGEDD